MGGWRPSESAALVNAAALSAQRRAHVDVKSALESARAALRQARAFAAALLATLALAAALLLLTLAAPPSAALAARSSGRMGGAAGFRAANAAASGSDSGGGGTAATASSNSFHRSGGGDRGAPPTPRSLASIGPSMPSSSPSPHSGVGGGGGPSPRRVGPESASSAPAFSGSGRATGSRPVPQGMGRDGFGGAPPSSHHGQAGHRRPGRSGGPSETPDPYYASNAFKFSGDRDRRDSDASQFQDDRHGGDRHGRAASVSMKLDLSGPGARASWLHLVLTWAARIFVGFVIFLRIVIIFFRL